jgi:hypothetical protein
MTSSQGPSPMPRRANHPPSRQSSRSSPSRPADNVVELLQPGSFVKLRNQPRDLPPFQLIHCRGGRCWVRQQAWGPLVHWEVEHHQLTAG